MVDIQVLFTGLCLICLNQTGSMCEDKNGGPGYVYLVNASDNRKVCGKEVDGGHRPRLSFQEKFLLPGSTLEHTVQPTPDGKRAVVADLTGHEICIGLEQRPNSEADQEPAGTADGGGAGGARPINQDRRTGQKKPSFLRPDARSFDWIPSLKAMHSGVEKLCPEVDGALGDTELVAARIRLDRGMVLTPRGWHDSWGPWFWKGWRRLWALDYPIWDTYPVATHAATGSGTIRPSKLPATSGFKKHFPAALPARAGWLFEDVAEDAVVLVESCQDDRRQTLFRLRPRAVDGDPLRLHVSNAPDQKVGAPGHAHLNHFLWYYRLVDWHPPDGCDGRPKQDTCPGHLPVPTPRVQEQDSQRMHGVIVETDRCPPISGG